ncbi:MAG: iron-dependent repressor [Crocinitomicaceae bacterium]|nr:iron-dependent repressor [Crocinitomicaceae bacterium]
MRLSSSQENYLKAIYKLEVGDGIATNQSLAALVEATPASVTNMLRKLTEAGWVEYQAYQGATLTPSGRNEAVTLVRKHRLWEVFLVEKLHYDWDAVHSLAEELEHIGGEELINRLDAFLEHPAYDPHGDPIPNAKGVVRIRQHAIAASEAVVGDRFVVCGVKDSSSLFLRHLDKLSICLGKAYTLIDLLEFDQSAVWTEKDSALTSVSNEVAKNVLIQLTDE